MPTTFVRMLTIQLAAKKMRCNVGNLTVKAGSASRMPLPAPMFIIISRLEPRGRDVSQFVCKKVRHARGPILLTTCQIVCSSS